MKYEIAYVSQSGNSEFLAHGIADTLPHNETIVTDLKEENITGKAEINLLCFGVNKGAVPLCIMDALEELEGKTVLFFVTAGFEPEQQYVQTIENETIPFLPDNCNYKGLFVCPGKFSENVLGWANNILSNDPNNRYAQKIIDDFELSEGHPNEKDIQNAVSFLNSHI